jgi:hypothetical protein
MDKVKIYLFGIGGLILLVLAFMFNLEAKKSGGKPIAGSPEQMSEARKARAIKAARELEEASKEIEEETENIIEDETKNIES